MENTNRLNMRISTNTSFNNDDIKQTIVEYGKNFEKLEYDGSDSGANKEDMMVGNEYDLGKKVWNSQPSVGDYVGWVNARKGLYAPEWKPLKSHILNDLIRAKPDNGNVYKCVVAGRTMINTPTFLTNVNVEFNDARGNKWIPSRNYQVNEVAFSTDGAVTFYYICETAGLSGLVEPNWVATASGSTRIDGSVTWRKERTVKWKQVGKSTNFRPFGKIE